MTWLGRTAHEVCKRKDFLLHRIHLTPTSERLRLAKTWDLIGPMQRATDADDIKDHLLEASSNIGLSSLFAGWVPSLKRPLAPREVATKILHAHAPGAWSKRYLERAYVSRDPIVARLQEHSAPFTWADAYGSHPCQNDVDLIEGEASSFGLRQGYVVPIVMLGNLSLAFSFAGFSMDRNPELLLHLTFVTNVAAGHLVNLLGSRTHHEIPGLTSREIDCLSWAAEGKTDWEIATITGVSRPTVVKHLAAAREKLGAVNKFHAVAKALRLKLIR